SFGTGTADQPQLAPDEVIWRTLQDMRAELLFTELSSPVRLTAEARGIREFLAKYPESRHVPEAHARLDQLTKLSAVTAEPSMPSSALKTIVDRNTGVKLAVPVNLIDDSRETKFGRNWRTTDGRIEVDTLKFDDRTLRELYDKLRNMTGRRLTR